ncbi:MAG: hypothetical protein D3926_06335 [Desulfobacteraceae bacterium]|nr:MAG: hypothetical protein D3926_06335 [Desulfobacteraceae bacterium]
MKTLLRILACLGGLSGFGVIAAEILKKWEIIDPDLSLLWVVSPILLLYLCMEALNAPLIRDNKKLPEGLVKPLARGVHIILILVSILAVISIPFIWFGTIEQLAGGGELINSGK